jgi:hypothetical protein
MLLEMFDRGGPVMWPLAIASVFGLALILDRTFSYFWWYQRFGGVVRRLRHLFCKATGREPSLVYHRVLETLIEVQRSGATDVHLAYEPSE